MSAPKRGSPAWTVCAAALVMAACGGPQSTLDPAGRDAEVITNLFWWMAAGAGLIWLAVVGLTIHSARDRPKPHTHEEATLFIIVGGAVLPTVALAGLLSHGLSLMPEILAPPPEGSLKIAVSGEQWWWRVRYLTPDGGKVELANEVRLPVGERLEFQLESPDVIHSFWIPSLGGKMDMIPGRRTRLALEATRTGLFQGVCAEYCGTSHALMKFSVVVLEKHDFIRWLAHQAEPARTPAQPLARRGQELFLRDGCSACHAVRGTPAAGVVGPDLTHVGGREGLGAATLPNERDDFVRWLASTESLKPGVHMPAFGMLPAEDLQALAAYLDGLE
jgi:cytochrome c oxidase subunit 2